MSTQEKGDVTAPSQNEKAPETIQQSNASTPETTTENDQNQIGNKETTSSQDNEPPSKARSDGKVELTDQMAPEILGYAYPAWKKWMILTIIFTVQMSMNFNTSVFPSAVKLIPEDPRYEGVSEQGARVGQMIFLVAYAFGSEVSTLALYVRPLLIILLFSFGLLGPKSLGAGQSSKYPYFL